MHDRKDGTPSGDDRNRTLDTLDATEATRRVLYDEVVRVHFEPTAEEVQKAAEDPENHWVPDYGPDAAGLTVVRAYGRWFAIWRSLEEKDGPEERLWTVLRIVPDPEGPPGAVQFLEV